MTRAEWRRVLVETQRIAKAGHGVRAIQYLREHAHCGIREALEAVRRLRHAPNLRVK